MLKRQKFRTGKRFSLNRKYFLTLIPLLFLVLFFIIINKFLVIKKFEFHLNNLYCLNQNNLEKDLSVSNKNTFFTSEKDIDQIIFKKYPCIGSIKFKKNYPSTVEVFIGPRKPALILNSLKSATESGALNPDEIFIASESGSLSIPDTYLVSSGKIVVDEKGIVFSEDSSNYFVPKTDYIGKNLKIGEYGGDSVLSVIYILTRLQNLGIEITKSLILGDKILIVESDGKIFFSLQKDQNIQLASLQLILQKAKMSSSGTISGKMDSKKIQIIDLRFDKPVVTYTPKKK